MDAFAELVGLAHLLHQITRYGFARFMVMGKTGQHIGIPCPLLQQLRGRLYKVPFHIESAHVDPRSIAPQEVMDEAMQEAEDAANRVLGGEDQIVLSPQRSYVRRLQHLLGQRYNVHSTSRGRDPSRAVMFYKT